MTAINLAKNTSKFDVKSNFKKLSRPKVIYEFGAKFRIRNYN